MKPLKVEAVKLFTEVPNRGCLRNEQKDFRKESLESKLQLSLLQGRNMVYPGHIDPYFRAVILIPEPHFPPNFDP